MRPRLIALLLVCSACTAAPAAPEPAAGAAAVPVGSAVATDAAAAKLILPWTKEFLEPALLVADRIVVEGPLGLLNHAVLRQEPLVRYTSEHTADGLRQTLRRVDPAASVELRAQLDGWNLVALQELVLLERPGNVPVRVVAEGQVMFRPIQGGEVLRGARFEREGAIEFP